MLPPHTKGAWSFVTYENHLHLHKGTALQEMAPVVAAFVRQTPAWIPWSLVRAEPHPRVSSLSVQTTFPSLFPPTLLHRHLFPYNLKVRNFSTLADILQQAQELLEVAFTNKSLFFQALELVILCYWSVPRCPAALALFWFKKKEIKD